MASSVEMKEEVQAGARDEAFSLELPAPPGWKKEKLGDSLVGFELLGCGGEARARSVHFEGTDPLIPISSRYTGPLDCVATTVKTNRITGISRGGFTTLLRKKHWISLVEDLQPAVTHERISYHEILQATSSFDDSNLLGKGSFGSVYKGVFTTGRTWAVKVFHLQVEHAIRSFNTECEMLRNILHRNLTKVISSGTNLDFMALVLEYMPNGSLDKWLYSHNYILDAKKRLDIVIDVASALDYLHHGYSVPVVHCDLKPSNVLLDEDMVAHVSDLGISKFLKKEGTIAQTTTLATIGYTAPEYGREGIVSTKCDVYSFGIMLMEVFTRKRPTEDMFNEDLDLKLWVMQSLPDRVMQVIDGNLVREKDHQDDALVQCVSAIFELALNCSADSPDERTNVKDVHASLKKIKLRFLSNGTSSYN